MTEAQVTKSPFTDVMLDLETLGTAPGSVILSIGAVAFAEGTPESEWSTFNSGPISVRSCRSARLTIDESTLAWWLTQSPEARAVLDCALAPNNINDIWRAAGQFFAWWPENARLWGNGANFDEPLLAAAFTAAACSVPWKYSASRCFRTLKNQFRSVAPPDFVGVKHDALADALHQTRHLVKILDHIKMLEECFELNDDRRDGDGLSSLAEALGLCEDQHPETVNADPEEL